MQNKAHRIAFVVCVSLAFSCIAHADDNPNVLSVQERAKIISEVQKCYHRDYANPKDIYFNSHKQYCADLISSYYSKLINMESRIQYIKSNQQYQDLLNQGKSNGYLPK